MKKNNRNTTISVITASLLLLTTGCSQAAETVDIIATDPTFESSVTTINTEAETTAQTTAQIITAAQTTVITTIPVTEAPPVTVQTEAAPVPVITTTTKTAPAPTKTTTTTTKPEEPAQGDRSYLNLTPSEVQYILDECQKYAKSIGYKVMSYDEYLVAEEEYMRKQIEIQDNGGSDEELAAIRKAWKTELKCITDIPTEEFWSGNWHYIMYAGNFTKNEQGVYELWGYDTHCSTKEESIQHIIGYLKYWIDDEHSDNYQTGGRSISITGTKLRTFDNYGRENDGVWGMVSYKDIHREYASFNVYDLDTSYAFSVKSM